MDNNTWKSGDGTIHIIKDMNIVHIVRAIKSCEKNNRTGLINYTWLKEELYNRNQLKSEKKPIMKRTEVGVAEVIEKQIDFIRKELEYQEELKSSLKQQHDDCIDQCAQLWSNLDQFEKTLKLCKQEKVLVEVPTTQQLELEIAPPPPLVKAEEDFETLYLRMKKIKLEPLTDLSNVAKMSLVRDGYNNLAEVLTMNRRQLLKTPDFGNRALEYLIVFLNKRKLSIGQFISHKNEILTINKHHSF